MNRDSYSALMRTVEFWKRQLLLALVAREQGGCDHVRAFWQQRVDRIRGELATGYTALYRFHLRTTLAEGK